MSPRGVAHLKYKKLEWSLSKYSGTSVWRKTFFALVMVKYRQKKQEIKPRLFDISRFTVFERNSGEGRRSECLPKGGECYHLHLTTRLLSTQ